MAGCLKIGDGFLLFLPLSMDSSLHTHTHMEYSIEDTIHSIVWDLILSRMAAKNESFNDKILCVGVVVRKSIWGAKCFSRSVSSISLSFSFILFQLISLFYRYIFPFISFTQLFGCLFLSFFFLFLFSSSNVNECFN